MDLIVTGLKRNGSPRVVTGTAGADDAALRSSAREAIKADFEFSRGEVGDNLRNATLAFVEHVRGLLGMELTRDTPVLADERAKQERRVERRKQLNTLKLELYKLLCTSAFSESRMAFGNDGGSDQLVLLDAETIKSMRDLLHSESGATFFHATTQVETMLNKLTTQKIKPSELYERLCAALKTDGADSADAEQSVDAYACSYGAMMRGNDGESAVWRPSTEFQAAIEGVLEQVRKQTREKGDQNLFNHLVQKHRSLFGQAVAAVHTFNAARSGSGAAFSGQTHLVNTAHRARIATQLLTRKVRVSGL